MKNTIETPTGCKIAKTEIIEGNLIVTYERDLPEICELPYRSHHRTISLSTPERAEAILALGQLLEFAAYVGAEKFHYTFQFGFGKQDLANDFRKKYSDLFEKTKKIL